MAFLCLLVLFVCFVFRFCFFFATSLLICGLFRRFVREHVVTNCLKILCRLEGLDIVHNIHVESNEFTAAAIERVHTPYSVLDLDQYP